MYNQILITNILRLLDELNMSKKELAEKSGVSISSISELTNGLGNPSLKTMEDLSNALNIPLPVLLESSDVSDAELEHLSHGANKKSLPEGYSVVCAYLDKFQAYEFQQLDIKNRKFLRERLKKDRKIIRKLKD